MTTTISPQAVSDAGLNVVMESATSSMQFLNDGKTLIYIVNGDSGTPTCTATVQNKSVTKPGNELFFFVFFFFFFLVFFLFVFFSISSIPSSMLWTRI